MSKDLEGDIKLLKADNRQLFAEIEKLTVALKVERERITAIVGTLKSNAAAVTSWLHDT